MYFIGSYQLHFDVISDLLIKQMLRNMESTC